MSQAEKDDFKRTPEPNLPGDPPPEVQAEFFARDIAYEAMLRGLIDAMISQVAPANRETVRTRAINRTIKMIELLPLTDAQEEIRDLTRTKAAERVRNVFGQGIRRDH